MHFYIAEKGQGLVEYALILVMVAIVVIVILALLGPAIGKVFSNVVELI
ncbi:MAG TPA: pilus assembly protein [Longilinea sp.]|jgi:pilus assembly protein Flp/PilA|nr:pilus assembly protein [Longilinea sp.]